MSRGRWSRLLTGTLLLSLLVPASLALAGPAAATSGTIQDQASCQAAGGYWSTFGGIDATCELGPTTVPVGQTLTIAVDTTISGAVSVAGTLVVTDGYTLFSNNSPVTVDGTFRLSGGDSRARSSFTNNGSVVVDARGSRLEFFPSGPVTNNASGTITVARGALEFDTDNPVTNSGTISVSCAGTATVYPGTTYSGNPISRADCTPPAVTINQASGQADPTTSQPLAFLATFDKDVTGFDASDVLVTGATSPTVSVVASSATSYAVTVSGLTAAGPVSVSIPAGAAQSATGIGNAASTSTDGTVTLEPATLTVTPGTASIVSGGSQTYSVNGKDAAQNPLTVTGATLTISPDGSCTSLTCTATKVGPHVVTATSGSQSATAALRVVAGPAMRLEITPRSASVQVGKRIQFTSYLTDSYGNRVREVTGSTRFGLSGPGTCRHAGPVCTPRSVGRHVVVAKRGGAEQAAVVVATKRRPRA